MGNLIEPTQVNIVNLSLELEKAVIRHDLGDDGIIYINEDGFFPFWIKILESRSFICLSTHTFFTRATTQEQRFEFCNRLSFQFFMVTAYVMNDNILQIDHAIGFDDGLFQESFIRACRQFSRTIETALKQLDPDNELVLQPGQNESEEAESE